MSLSSHIKKVFICSIFFLFTPYKTQAQGPISFQPLDGTGITGFTDIETARTLGGFLNAGYQLLIGIASVLAVLMIFYAGFRYATTTSSGAKTDAKNRILGALGGLLLALSSYLILSTIDTGLVDTDLAFQEFTERELVFKILSEEEREAILAKHRAVITVEPDGSLDMVDPGNLLNSGSGSVSGIPTKGDYNPTLNSTITESGGIEPHMTKESFNGDVWVTANTSWFAGPHDDGVRPEEIGALPACREILRDLPNTFQGVALRWDYTQTPARVLSSKKLVIYSPETQKTAYVTPCDWGPHSIKTTMSVDLTPGACRALGFTTNLNPTKSELGQCHGNKVLFRFAQ